MSTISSAGGALLGVQRPQHDGVASAPDATVDGAPVTAPGAASPLNQATVKAAGRVKPHAVHCTQQGSKANSVPARMTPAEEAWQPNLLDARGEPSCARSALRQSGKQTVDIKTETDALIGWGTANGATAFAFTGYDAVSRAPVVFPSANLLESYWYLTEPVADDATGTLERLAKEGLGVNLDLDSSGFKWLFDPKDGALQPYHRSGQETFLRREFVHPLGFYPGDPTDTGLDWQAAQDKYPDNTPDLEERRWGGTLVTTTGGFAQLWGVLNHKGSGVAILEYVNNRLQQNSYAYRSRTVEGGEQTIGALGVEGKFTQSVARLKLTSQGVPAAEVGNFSLANLSALTVFKPKAKAASDWWLVNGQLHDNLEDPLQSTRGEEFASLKALGFKLKGESLLPSLGDEDAHVFFNVPNANVNFGNRDLHQAQDVLAIPPDAAEGEYFKAEDGTTYQRPLADSNEYRTQTDREADEGLLAWARRHFPLGNKSKYISAETLAALMTQIASRVPEHIELAYVTPETLVQANADKVYTIVDPTSGKTTPGFKVGDWVDTGLLQIQGQPGLFVDRDRLPPSMFKGDGSVDPQAQLQHWKDHLSPQGEPVLTTPREAVRKATGPN